MNKKSNPSGVYNIAKFIAVLLVVFAHSTRMYTPTGAFTPINQSFILSKATDYIYLFHMPLFMFVSGAVYGLCIGQGKYKNILKFIGNKAKRLLIPYYVFGFLYVAPAMCLLGLTSRGYWGFCHIGILRSLDSRHLWFLLCLFIIFLFAIFLRKLLLKSHFTRLVVLIVSVAVYLLAKHLPGDQQLSSAATYQLFFLIGALFHFYYDKIATIFVKFWYAIILLPFLLLGYFFYCPNDLLYFTYRLAGVVMLMMLSVFLERGTRLIGTKFFQCITDTSMGIFLFHPMIIYLGYYYLASKNIPPIILSVAMAVVSIFISIVLTKVLRRLRLGIILGE